jgi:hypothetical protein
LIEAGADPHTTCDSFQMQGDGSTTLSMGPLEIWCSSHDVSPGYISVISWS